VTPPFANAYRSAVQRHVLPAFGEHLIKAIAPLRIDEFAQAKTNGGLSAKTVRNLLLVLQGILAFAVDNDLISKSPIRKSDQPIYRRREKPTWSPTEVLAKGAREYGNQLIFCIVDGVF
jgi:hypothetical protein